MSSSSSSSSPPAIQQVMLNPAITKHVSADNNDQLPTLLITGIIQNGEQWIEKVLRNALTFCQLGVETTNILGSCQLLIYENGSTDNTRQKLRQLVAVLPGLEVLLGNDPPRWSGRTERIAYARNALLEHVLEEQKMSSGSYFSHLAVMDLDGAFNMEPASELLEAFHYTYNWDVLAFDATVYYDYWALRCADHGETITAHQNCNYPPNHGSHTCKKCFFDDCFFSKLMSAPHKTNKSPFENLVPVQSAFNGLAFYRLDSIGECRYASTSRSNAKRGLFGGRYPDCEHVAFHLCIGNQKRESHRQERVMVAPVKQLVNTTQGGNDLKKHIAYTTRHDDRCHHMEKKA